MKLIFWTNAYNENRPEFNNPKHHNAIRFELKDIKEVCAQIKNGRSPVPGNVPGKLIKSTQRSYMKSWKNYFRNV